MFDKYRIIGVIIITIIVLQTCVVISPISSQDRFKEAVQQLSSDNVVGYVQPMFDGFGANLNSGFPASARISQFGVHIRLELVLMGTIIGDKEKTYFATPPEPFPQEAVKTATVFGGEGTLLTHPSGASYKFQNGQIRTGLIPFAVPQITLGNVYGTQVVIRYLPVISIEDLPDISMFGFGARHSVSQYLAPLPVDIAAGLFYQTFTISDNFTSKAFSFNAQVSKTIQVLTIYGGFQYETTSINLSYTYTGWLPHDDTSDRYVSVDFKGKNRLRLRAGAGLSLGVLHLFTDLNLGRVTVLSAGLGLGI